MTPRNTSSTTLPPVSAKKDENGGELTEQHGSRTGQAVCPLVNSSNEDEVSRFTPWISTARGVWRRQNSVIRRDIVTASPPRGDYILSPTGLTWNISRSNGNGSVMSISVGGRNRKIGLATLLSLAERDKADAWETTGTGPFWLIKRYRSSP